MGCGSHRTSTRSSTAPVLLREALAESRNVPAVRIARHCGFPAVAARFSQLGLQLPADPPPSFVLGSVETSPLTVARAYTVLATPGEVHEPYSVAFMETSDGGNLQRNRPSAHRVATPSAAFIVRDLLRSAVEGGTATVGAIEGVEVVAKTGTSSELRDAWFAGQAGAVVAVVWVGLDGTGRLGLTGSVAAGPLWHDFVGSAVAVRPAYNVERPRDSSRCGCRRAPACWYVKDGSDRAKSCIAKEPCRRASAGGASIHRCPSSSECPRIDALAGIATLVVNDGTLTAEESMGARRVFVSGIGAITPFGVGAPLLRDSLQAGRSAIGPIRGFDSSRYPVHIGGEVPEFPLTDHFDERELSWMSRLTSHAVIAAREAFADASRRARSGSLGGDVRHRLQHDPRSRTALLPLGADRSIGRAPHFDSPVHAQAPSAQIAMRLKLNGPSLAVSTACSSGSNAIGLAYQEIASGRADLMVTGGGESSLTETMLACWCRMRVLSKRNDAPEKASRPFDRERDGMVVSDGTVMFVLESEESLARRGGRARAELAGFAANCDASHLTAPVVDTEVAVMRAALGEAGITPDEVDLVCAHGTATRLNDTTEGAALEQLFASRERPPALTAVKAMTGHTMGASGALGPPRRFSRSKAVEFCRPSTRFAGSRVLVPRPVRPPGDDRAEVRYRECLCVRRPERGLGAASRVA